MAATNLAYIEKMLRAGKEPKDLGGKECGRGAFKAAYKFDSPAGGFVVKESLQCGQIGNGEQVKLPPSWIKTYGARQPRTYKCGKYIIQEYVTPARKYSGWHDSEAYKIWEALHKDDRSMELDIHQGNVGVDSNGQLVVFDW